MKKLLTILTILCSSSLISQNIDEEFHRAKIYYNQASDLSALIAAGVPIDHGSHEKNLYFESDFSETDIKKVQALGYTIEIVIRDVRSFYLNQNNPNHKDYQGEVENRNSTCIPNITNYNTPVNYDIKSANAFGGFYTYSEVLQELDDMHAQYPNLISERAEIKNPWDVSNQHIHQTAGGRFLQWVRISDYSNSFADKPKILYNALHHAREPASMQQLIFYMWYLLENYETDLEVKSIVDSNQLYFIPVVNPDGYVYNEQTFPNGGGLWRKNRRNHGNGNYGVDLNRNYSYVTPQGQEVWGTAGISNDNGSDIYPGSAPFSEPESRALRFFIESHNFKIALNNHSYSELLLYPFGYTTNSPTEDHELFVELSELMISQNGYSGMLASELYPAAGNSDDFMYGSLTTEFGGTREKIISMTPEIGTSFWPASSSIESICKEMVFHNLTAARLLGNYATITDTSNSFTTNTITDVQYNLKRLGISDSAIFTVSINPTSDNIQSVGEPNSHENISILESVNSAITINLANGINVGDYYSYDLEVNSGSFFASKNVTKIFGEPTAVLEELGNDPTANWDSSTWSTTTEDSFSPSSSITDSPNTNYSNNQSTFITLSNEIDLTGTLEAILTFKAKWDIEASFDYVQIEISTNNGSTWVPQCGNYTKEGTESQINANGEPLYDGVQNDWIEETINLNEYLDESILIRFSLISDAFENFDGFYFDDLILHTLQNNLNLNTVNPTNFRLFPNPVKNLLNIKSNVQDYDVSIFNLHGQIIYTKKGSSNDLKIDTKKLTSGVYFVLINSNDNSQSFKIVKQ